VLCYVMIPLVVFQVPYHIANLVQAFDFFSEHFHELRIVVGSRRIELRIPEKFDFSINAFHQVKLNFSLRKAPALGELFNKTIVTENFFHTKKREITICRQISRRIKQGLRSSNNISSHLEFRSHWHDHHIRHTCCSCGRFPLLVQWCVLLVRCSSLPHSCSSFW
jgi:hypothetical protein